MIEPLKDEIDNLKGSQRVLLYLWVPVKLLVAYILIVNFDFGLFIVIGYIFFVLEMQSGTQLIVTQEAGYHIDAIYEKFNENNPSQVQQKLSEINSKLEELNTRLFEIEVNSGDVQNYT